MTEQDDKLEDVPTDTPEKLYNLIKEKKRQQIEEDLIVDDDEFELKSTEPVRVVRYYLCTKRIRWADETYKDNSYDLTRFLEYCNYAGIDDLSKLSPRDMERFKDWRQRDGNITLTTLDGQLSNIRPFIRKCERLEIVEEGVADSIEMPDLEDSDEVSYVRIGTERAEAILDYHETFDYATREHAVFALMWAILSRLGDCRALDLKDYQENEDGEKYVEFRHVPEQGTPLKNQESNVDGEGGEREINLPDWVAEILDDYIEQHRKTVTDEYGREPLFTTKYGRVSKSTLRRDLYRITQPCRYDQGCPVGNDPSQCEARNKNSHLSKCPENVSPHPVRRGGICHQIQEGVPKDTICERADVSREVLNKHYDLRSLEEARIQRRKELRQHLDGYGGSTQSASEHGDTVPDNRWERIQEISPLMADIASTINGLGEDTERLDCTGSINTRTAKGVVGYSLFVLLTGINFGLMGIGFNPVTREIIFNL